MMKSFPGARALDGMDFEVLPGEVHALVGENGAGKSTLAKAIAGLLRLDGGAMHLRGRPHAAASRSEAQRLGVSMAMQELNLISTLTVSENLFLDRLPRRFGFIDRRALDSRARPILAAFGLEGLDPRRAVGALGIGQKQLLEIAGAFARQPSDLLILDEPTSALTEREAELLFVRLREHRSAGAGIIYISHRLEEVRRLADRITVLRDGKRVATRRAAEVGIGELIRLMAGRDLGTAGGRSAVPGGLALRVEDLRRGAAVQGVSFEVRRGEVFGLGGLMGSGRTESARALFGADRRDGGRIYLHGARRPARIRSPRDAVRLGLAMLPEDRKEQGLLLPLSLRANISLARMQAVARWRSWILRRREVQVAGRFTGALGIKCRSVEQPAHELSGGNQQKVAFAKWLHRDPEILIVDEPTRGIDAAAKSEVHRLLEMQAGRGKAVIVISSELEELMALCDRIGILSAGRLAATFQRGEWTREALLAAALSGYGNEDRKNGSFF